MIVERATEKTADYRMNIGMRVAVWPIRYPFIADSLQGTREIAKENTVHVAIVDDEATVPRTLDNAREKTTAISIVSDEAAALPLDKAREDPATITVETEEVPVLTIGDRPTEWSDKQRNHDRGSRRSNASAKSANYSHAGRKGRSHKNKNGNEKPDNGRGLHNREPSGPSQHPMTKAEIPTKYCTSCHRSNHHRGDNCAKPKTFVIARFDTIWHEFCPTETSNIAGKVPSTLIEVKDMTYIFGKFLVESGNEFIMQRDKLVTTVDDFMRTNIRGDSYNAWRDYMCSCALATNHLFSQVRKYLQVYMGEQLDKSLRSLAEIDKVSINQETRFEDMDRYLHSIRDDHEKIKITSLGAFNLAIQDLGSFWKYYRITQKDLVGRLENLVKDHPEFKASGKVEAGIRMPAILLPTLAEGPPTTFCHEDYKLPPVEAAERAWQEATHEAKE
ncbi:hypothetical protein PV08_11736 [Exophiala spinifera]|uniref:Uncharacterized protein n=1 Tax=Exophiala spinifera TaxID=91928 RepID=A0A0D2AU14_9EURO|nr:uncharacterized protein PV08_11736 [Exophiala spinifera]KIW09960.1 hypothetical protein PV08_11736 [Exophiala spinifera]